MGEREGEYEGDDELVQAVVEDIDPDMREVTNADQPAEEGLPADTERQLTDGEVKEWAIGLIEMTEVEYRLVSP